MQRAEIDKYFGKPSGLSLAEHTRNVTRFGGYIRRRFPFLASKYERLTGQQLDTLCELAEHYHDYGKMMPPWHDACKRDVALYHDWLRTQGIDPSSSNRELHARYEAATDSGAPNLRKAGFRHELGSAAWLRKRVPELPTESLAAVAAHHAKLSATEYADKRWRKDGQKLSSQLQRRYSLKETYDFFVELSQRTGAKEWQDAVLDRYRYAAVRALLQVADTRASRWEGMGDAGMLDLHNFARPVGYGSGAQLRPVQQAALASADHERTILRAPTGSGKTFASLLWAAEQICGPTPKADRLVIAMPTRFTSNALHTSVREHLQQVGLFHSSAFHHLFGEDGDESWGSLDVEQQKLAKQLAFPTTVCTIDHLLTCLTGTREEHHTSFFFLANSCVVFDETDFYDEFVQQNLAQLLEVLRLLNVPTLIMSATVPDSARKLYGVDEPIVETAQPGSDRVVKNMHWLGAAASAADCSEVLDEMIERGSGIVYANTVARALDYYDYLQARAGEVPVVIYHSRFTEPDKKRIEQQLVAILGEGMHRDGQNGQGIAVLTQIGEMSINISSNLMLTDLCPWDRLAQRVGRLARFAVKKQEQTVARVYVCEPMRVNREGIAEAFPAPYGNLEKGKGWTLNPAYRATLASIQDMSDFPVRLTPAGLVKLTNEIYSDLGQPSTRASLNRAELVKLMQKNWLLTGGQHTSDDEGTAGNWTARSIPEQRIVLTQWTGETIFRSYAAMNAYALKHGVAIPAYKIEQDNSGVARGEEQVLTLQEFTIGRGTSPDTVPIYLAHKGAYAEKVGLAALYGYPWTADIHL